ncbi:MAG: SRPBCC family protein [Candidatus Eremiobacteraeota bacterium]|nr:SRPBCC family protein [Candidatus Eremiobacteraeota bacterium]
MAVLNASLDVASPAETAFELVCTVEKWPVWLAFLRSAELADPAAPLAVGSEIRVRSVIPGEAEELYEVDTLIANYRLSLVGAYSVRRRIDIRIERKTTLSRIRVRVDYPAYYGRLGALYDQLTAGRKLASQLSDSLAHFKGLAEFDRSKDALLADF